MKKDTWKTLIQIAISILTAIATTPCQLHPGIGLPPRLAGISERPSHPLFAQSPRDPHSREPRAFRFGMLKKRGKHLAV